jgi:hypothetical protein
MSDRPIWGGDKQERCHVCGEETAMGSVLHNDRRELTRQDGDKLFLCSLCVRRIETREPQIDISDPDALTSRLAAAEFGMWGKF